MININITITTNGAKNEGEYNNVTGILAICNQTTNAARLSLQVADDWKYVAMVLDR